MWYHCKGLYNKGDGRFLTDNQSKSLELILTDSDDAHMLLGTHDKHIKFLEENTHVTINSRGEVIQLIGESSEVELVASVLRALQTLIQRGIKVHTPDVVSALKMAKAGNLEAFIAMYEEEIMKDHHGRAIRIKNVGQKNISMQLKLMTSFSGWDLRGQEKPFSRGDGSSDLKKRRSTKNYFNSSSGGSWRKLGLFTR